MSKQLLVVIFFCLPSFIILGQSTQTIAKWPNGSKSITRSITESDTVYVFSFLNEDNYEIVDFRNLTFYGVNELKEFWSKCEEILSMDVEKGETYRFDIREGYLSLSRLHSAKSLTLHVGSAYCYIERSDLRVYRKKALKKLRD